MFADALTLVVELVLLFFSVAFLVHLTQRWLGSERLRRWMGGRPVVAALKGIAVGFVTPFCTYSAIPVLVGLRRAGVPPAGYVAFIVAAPVLDPVLFGALVLIVGIQAAVVYLVIAFTGAMTLALVAQRVGIEHHLKPVGEPVLVGSHRPTIVTSSETPQPCDDACPPVDAPWRGLAIESREGAAVAARLLRALGPILLLGVAVGLGIELFVSPELVASVAGDQNALAIPIAAGLGTPLYFNTGLFVPIADSLATVGVGIGAIVALTIAGAGANVPEFVILSKLAKGRLLSLFVGYVFLVAVVGGFVAQTVV